MHEAIMAYYRRLSKTGFEYAGKLENASIFLKTFGEVSPVCGNTDDFLYLYIHVADGILTDIRYQCICDPASNVAIEVFCTLVKGKTLDQAALVKEDAFSQFLGCDDRGMREKARFLQELLNEGILRYKPQMT